MLGDRVRVGEALGNLALLEDAPNGGNSSEAPSRASASLKL